MKYTYLIIIIFIIILFYIYYKNKNIQYNVNHHNKKIKINETDTIYEIFKKISSHTKVNFININSQNIYTESTLNVDKKLLLINNIQKIIKYITLLNNNYEYYLDNIYQVYEQIDNKNNKRYIIICYIYDIKNYYTMKIYIDFIIKNNDDIIINSIGNEHSSYYNIINRYDYTILHGGVLENKNMFNEDIFSIIEETYIKKYNIIGINNSTLDNSIYLISNSNYNLEDNTIIYLPNDIPCKFNNNFCEKHTQNWDNTGVNIQISNNNNCVHNNSTRKELNQPYYGPSIITQRVDNNAYSWLNDPLRGVNGRNTELH